MFQKMFQIIILAISSMLLQVHGINSSPSAVDLRDISAEDIFETVRSAIQLGQWQNKIEMDIESMETGKKGIGLQYACYLVALLL